jgi:hypothetical protein
MNKKKSALVCIAKNEDHYIKEWIEYHTKLGFDKIFIYQNDWRCNLEHPNITKYELDGYGKQTEAYNFFIRDHHTEYEWAAFFDVDEFLVLKKHQRINDFLEEYKQYPALGIGWYFFGTNGHEVVKDNNYSVIDRFTKRRNILDKFFKSIIKLDKEVVMDVHSRHGSTYFTNGKEVMTGREEDCDAEVAQLNHYFVKTIDEFKAKVSRGLACLRPADDGYIRSMDYFPHHNNNEVDDFHAFNFKHDIIQNTQNNK